MAFILNIETSTEVCSVNLARNGKLLIERESSTGLNHSQLLTVFIDEIFRENGFSPDMLDAVAVSKGPGSYTGLRIGVSVAKGLCYSLGIPLLALGTLDVLGRFAAEHRFEYLNEPDIDENLLFCPMIDARRMEVYTSLFNSAGKQLEPVSAKIIDETYLSGWLQQHRILFFGNGSEKCRQALDHPNALFLGPLFASARFMIKYAEEKFNKKEWENVAYFEPFYLKNFVATIPKKNQP
jgi:tRNA threonylcarbamoyladenosine biosynthesis protein TsaB